MKSKVSGVLVLLHASSATVATSQARGACVPGLMASIPAPGFIGPGAVHGSFTHALAFSIISARRPPLEALLRRPLPAPRPATVRALSSQAAEGSGSSEMGGAMGSCRQWGEDVWAEQVCWL